MTLSLLSCNPLAAEVRNAVGVIGEIRPPLRHYLGVDAWYSRASIDRFENGHRLFITEHPESRCLQPHGGIATELWRGLRFRIYEDQLRIYSGSHWDPGSTAVTINAPVGMRWSFWSGTKFWCLPSAGVSACGQELLLDEFVNSANKGKMHDSSDGPGPAAFNPGWLTLFLQPA